jgi:hypothetical protein
MIDRFRRRTNQRRECVLGSFYRLVNASWIAVHWARSVTRFSDGRKALNEWEELNKEEARILDLLARGLSGEFPNPQRVGCPDPAILRGIAFRSLRLAEVQQWLDHLGSCSPCYQEFTELHQQAVSQRRST